MSSMATAPDSGKRGREVRWIDETDQIAKSVQQPKDDQASSAPFIIEDGRSRPAAAQSRQLIHSYASRHRPKAVKPKARQLNKAVGGQRLTWKLEPQDGQASKDLAMIQPLRKQNVTSPLSIRMDPFQVAQVPSNQETDRMIHHWAGVVELVGRQPLSPEFWPFVASSPALLYATMSIAALHMYNEELKTSRKPSYTFLRYKYESIKEVNRNMQSTHEQLSDSTVCAIAVLALSDSVLESQAAFEKHVTGLGAIIEKRGGFHTLQGLTRQIVMWLVNAASTLQRAAPLFYVAPAILSSRETAAMSVSKTFIKNYLCDILPSTLEEPIMTFYAELKNMSDTLDEPDFLADKAEDTSFVDKCMHLEKQNLSLIDLLGCSNRFLGQDLLLAFAMAAMIFQYTIIRFFPSIPGVMREEYTVKLRDVLQRINITQSAVEYPEMMVWIISLGALENVPNENFTTYLEMTRKVCQKLEIEEVESVAAMLRRFAWPENPKVVDFRTLWRQVLQSGL